MVSQNAFGNQCFNKNLTELLLFRRYHFYFFGGVPKISGPHISEEQKLSIKVFALVFFTGWPSFTEFG